MEPAAAWMRQELQDMQIVMQQQYAVLIQQQAHAKRATARAQTAEEGSVDMTSIAASLADVDIIDNKALDQPFKITGKIDSDSQSGTTQFECSWELASDKKFLKP